MESDPKEELAALVGHLRSYVLYQQGLGVEALPRSSSEPQDLAAVREELGDCHRCRLSEKRQHIVFGEGSEEARLVFVGEGPGHEEDLQGRPFVGKAGQLLTRIIGSIGHKRDQVYITNVVKCRPPENRAPWPDEIGCCFPFLTKQLKIIRPKVICTLGNAATQALLNKEAGISAVRGRFHLWKGIQVMPTFHPAYLLRNPERKKETWEDIKAVYRELTGDSL
jgi:DNA polymerase